MSGSYYVPEKSYWPIVGSVGLFLMAEGGVHLFHGQMTLGLPLLCVGVVVVIGLLCGWFHDVIKENRMGLHSAQMGRSYRWGMIWFIFSEIMFFGAFFGALFYVRNYSVPWLGGEGAGAMTHEMLWPNFRAEWPLYVNPNNQLFVGPKHILGVWGIPAINTLLLLSSAVTLTWAHWALKFNRRAQVIIGLICTIVLGLVFLGCQGYEYYLAHNFDGLQLRSGIYGSTFFMLTGFHGAHVTLGAIMLMVILGRVMKGHFTPENHFAFEACAWYWHFVDYVWLTLFVFVYCL